MVLTLRMSVPYTFCISGTLMRTNFRSGDMISTNSEDLSSQYAHLVQQEDDYVDQLVTCNKLILDAMDIIAKRAGVLPMDTVKQAAYHLHAMEQDLNRNLFEVRLEKSILANQMSQST